MVIQAELQNSAWEWHLITITECMLAVATLDLPTSGPLSWLLSHMPGCSSIRQFLFWEV